MLETTIGIGLVIPGSTIILFMSALAANGNFDLGDLIWFAVIGAILGDNINYYLGKKYGSKIFTKGFWFFKPKHFEKGKKFFEKHGAKSVFFGRFIPSLKEIVPFIAGTFGMKRLPFMLWNILGAIGWSLAWILPGYFFAQSLNIAPVWLTRAGYLLLGFVLIFIIFYILKIILVKRGKRFFTFLFSILRSFKIALAENKDVQNYKQKHKTFFNFINKRLNKKTFSGLPLTILSLSFVYILFLFIGIVKNVLTSDIVLSADIRVMNLLELFRNATFVKIFFWISLLGKWQIILTFSIATIIIFLIWKKQKYILPLLISIGGSEIFVYLSKLIFHRNRPSVAVYTENSFSFPSGHATIAIAFYGFITYLLIKNIKTWAKKINVFFAGLLIIALIGFSRLYLGVHFVSDVWGGYLAGTIWLIFAISLIEYLNVKHKTIHVHLNVKRKNIFTYSLITVAIIFYGLFSYFYEIPFVETIKTNLPTTVTNATDIFTTDQLKYTETLLGNKQEPISFLIAAKDDTQLINLFNKANWLLADDINVQSLFEIAKAAVLKTSYNKAPMTPDFWDSTIHNFGFEKATADNNVRIRHHARFWRTTSFLPNGMQIYVGTASFDNGIKWGVTHKINPDIDTEREFLLNDLKQADPNLIISKQQLVDPKIGTNFSGDLFFTDGEMYIIEE